LSLLLPGTVRSIRLFFPLGIPESSDTEAVSCLMEGQFPLVTPFLHYNALGPALGPYIPHHILVTDYLLRETLLEAPTVKAVSNTPPTGPLDNFVPDRTDPLSSKPENS